MKFRDPIVKYFLIIGIFLIVISSAKSQWIETNGPYCGTVNSITYFDNYLFCGSGSGVYRSANGGGNWEFLQNGIPTREVTSVSHLGQELFATIKDVGLYASLDQGESWQPAGSGLISLNVNTLYCNDTTLYAGTGGALFQFDPSARTWTCINNGLPVAPVNAIISAGGQLFAGIHGNGIYRSSDKGLHWLEMNSGLGNQNVLSLCSHGGKLFA
ncbi:MAG: hypothetical protein WCL00_07930, partial [Bacteroidota bacterium]